MGLHWLDAAVLVVYLAVMFAIGLACTRLVRSQKDLFLGGRRFGKFMMTFQSFGIGTHSEHVVAVVGKCYQHGLAGIWWQFLWLFSTPVYWLSHPMLRRMRMVTSADFWAERYSPGLAKVSAVLGLLQMTFTIATMLKAIAVVIEPLTDGALSETVVIPVCACLFVFYGIAGGLYAATITDVIQGLLTIVLSLLLLPFMFAKTGGMRGLHEKLDASLFDYTAPGEMTIFYIVMLSVNALVGVYTAPTTMTNLGSGRNEWDVRVGTMAGTLLKRLCTVSWAFLGLGALVLCPGLGDEEHAFGHLIKLLLPPGLAGLMMAAILAAAMSTCDAMMLSGSALFTRNLYRSSIARDRDEHHYVRVGRIAAGVIVLVSVAIAFGLPNVLEGLKQVWAFYAFMGLAWWGGVIWPRATAAAAWTSTIVTSLAYGATILFNRYNPETMRDLKYPEQIAIYLGCGAIALIVISWLTSHRNPDAVRRFYRKMRTPTTQRSEFDADE